MFRKERYTFMMKVIEDFWNEEDGIGVVEIILILVEKYFISYSL